jgi:hypothetical protein
MGDMSDMMSDPVSLNIPFEYLTGLAALVVNCPPFPLPQLDSLVRDMIRSCRSLQNLDTLVLYSPEPM